MGILRFILSLLVLILHCGSFLGYSSSIPGYLAVQCFYIISGFLMTLVYCEKYSKLTNPYYIFVSNRFFKLFPMYWFTIFLVMLFSVFVGIYSDSFGKFQYYIDYYNRGESIYSLGTVFLSNFTLIGQDILSFFTIDKIYFFKFNGLQSEISIQELLFVPIAWTVSIEILFYLVTPFIALKNIKLIVLLIFFVLLLRFLLYLYGNNNGFFIYRFAPTEFFWYLMGVLSYKLYKIRLLPDLKYGYSGAAIILSILCFFPYFGIVTDVILYLMFFIFLGAILYKFSSFAIDKFLGELSYPIYILHVFVVSVVQSNFVSKYISIGEGSFVVTLLLSIIVNRYFLSKIEAYRKTRIIR